MGDISGAVRVHLQAVGQRHRDVPGERVDQVAGAPVGDLLLPLAATQILWINLVTDARRRWRWELIRPIPT